MLCLIANTAPVAWGSIGTPILTLSKVTGLNVESLSATSGRILPLLSILIPFWLVRVMTSWREMFGVWVPLAAIGGTFAAVQFLWSNFVGFELVDIVAAVASTGRRRDRDPPLEAAGDLAVRERDAERDCAVPFSASSEPIEQNELTAGRVARAWMPYGLLIVTVMIWGLPAIKAWGTPP